MRSTPGPDRPGSGPQPSYKGDWEVSGDWDWFNDRLELKEKRGWGMITALFCCVYGDVQFNFSLSAVQNYSLY